jgi:hypothetical protein
MKTDIIALLVFISLMCGGFYWFYSAVLKPSSERYERQRQYAAKHCTRTGYVGNGYGVYTCNDGKVYTLNDMPEEK